MFLLAVERGVGDDVAVAGHLAEGRAGDALAGETWPVKI